MASRTEEPCFPRRVGEGPPCASRGADPRRALPGPAERQHPSPPAPHPTTARSAPRCACGSRPSRGGRRMRGRRPPPVKPLGGVRAHGGVQEPIPITPWTASRSSDPTCGPHSVPGDPSSTASAGAGLLQPSGSTGGSRSRRGRAARRHRLHPGVRRHRILAMSPHCRSIRARRPQGHPSHLLDAPGMPGLSLPEVLITVHRSIWRTD